MTARCIFLALFFSAVAALLLLACEDEESTRGGPADGGDGDSDGDGDADGDADSDTGPDENCSEASQKIYVVDRNKKLYSFYPPDKQFHEIGAIDCPGAGAPFSMAVSRNDKAYVLYSTDLGGCVGINEVSILDASCSGKTAFACGDQGFKTFGMGFATDGAGTANETLYIGTSVQGTAQAKLGSLDTTTWKATAIGNLPGAPEMTGTGKGELWAFFAWIAKPMVAQVNKTQGGVSNQVQLTQISGNAAFAFAHWGGDFYLFHAPTGTKTTVWRLSNGQLTNYMSTQLYIVGAGVSTCAPTAPVK